MVRFGLLQIHSPMVGATIAATTSFLTMSLLYWLFEEKKPLARIRPARPQTLRRRRLYELSLLRLRLHRPQHGTGLADLAADQRLLAVRPAAVGTLSQGRRKTHAAKNRRNAAGDLGSVFDFVGKNVGLPAAGRTRKSGGAAFFSAPSARRRPCRRDELEASFEAGEAAAVAVVFEALPRIAAAQIKIAEHHAAEVGQVRDAALAGGDRGVERDGADDPDEVLHLDRKEKIKINDAVGIDQPVGEQNAVDARRRADARPHLIGQEERIENAAADHGDKIIVEKKLAAPAPLQIAAEHPQGEHVEQKMEQPAVEKLVGKQAARGKTRAGPAAAPDRNQASTGSRSRRRAPSARRTPRCWRSAET